MGKHQKPKPLINKTAVGIVLAGGVATAPLLTAVSANAATTVPNSSPWACIVDHESGDQNLSYGDASSTGYLQIQQPTWDDFGGQQYASQAYLATEQQQFLVADQILASQGPGAWSTNNSFGCGLTSSTPDPFGSSGVAPAPAPVAAPVAPVSDPAPATPSGSGSNTYTVQSGDNLSLIAFNTYGDASKWQDVYAANAGVIGSDPNLILPGQVLTLP